MRETKHNTKQSTKSRVADALGWVYASIWVIGILLVCSAGIFVAYQKHYEGKVYPNVTIDNISFAGRTQSEVQEYWQNKNALFPGVRLELHYDGKIATISGADLELGYDATLSAVQAYGVGRTNQWLSNFYTEITQQRINLTPYFRWNWTPIDETLARISDEVKIPVQDALFTFSDGRVTAFKPSKNGRALNVTNAKAYIHTALTSAASGYSDRISIDLPVDITYPSVTTDKANSFGIKELIGRGYSEFTGSIPGRVHNVALAANRLNGVLIKPGETFSFNATIGDISAATGYQSAYIIKDGRTVLGDGGGVCQVSTTIFRAALNSGLPIVERHAHAYRVHYYEDDGSKPGLDATVYNPGYDLKFKNNTPGYILIQTKTDRANLSLTFEFYGTRDGRLAQISNQKLWGVTPPPPALYQDDPTLPNGTVKQVDFAAWGAKASFDYKVTRGTEILENKTFNSNFRPWQAVYLRGTL